MAIYSRILMSFLRKQDPAAVLSSDALVVVLRHVALRSMHDLAHLARVSWSYYDASRPVLDDTEVWHSACSYAGLEALQRQQSWKQLYIQHARSAYRLRIHNQQQPGPNAAAWRSPPSALRMPRLITGWRQCADFQVGVKLVWVRNNGSSTVVAHALLTIPGDLPH